MTPVTQFHQLRPTFEHVDLEEAVAAQRTKKSAVDAARTFQGQKGQGGLIMSPYTLASQCSKKSWLPVEHVCPQSTSESRMEFKRVLLSEKQLQGNGLQDAASSINPGEPSNGGEEETSSTFIKVDRDAYLDQFAPLTIVSLDNDFSTNYLNQDGGTPNLSANFIQKQCGQDWRAMVLLVLRKCNVMSLSDLRYILDEPMKLAKIS